MRIYPDDIDVRGDQQIAAITTGTITVHPGATLMHVGTHNGSISVRSGATLVLKGLHNGSLNIEAEGLVTVDGDLMGSVNVQRGGTFALSTRGRHGGSINNYGLYVNEGLRGGTVNGDAPEDREGGRVKHPDKIVDGDSYYSWGTRR